MTKTKKSMSTVERWMKKPGFKEAVAKVSEIRTKVCQAASAPAARAPSLSDALTNPIPDSNNIKTGRGTFDTLTGTPLGK